MGSAVTAWHCRCGYSNAGARRCVGCHKPSPSLRRQLRKRRLISAVFLAATVTVSSAKWSPVVGQAAPPTPTTVPQPAPVTAAAPPQTPATPRPSQPRQRRTTAAPRPTASAPASTPGQDRCLAARQAVENAGDQLAAGFEFRCPDSEFPRWGATSLPPCESCWVAINTADIGPSDTKLRHVVAHEFCHSNGVRDEQAADDCAAGYGFPNTYFKR